MKLNRLVALALATALTATLAACGGGSASTTAAPAAAPAETKAEAAAPEAAPADSAADYSSLEQTELILADTAAAGAALQLFNEKFAANVDAITGGQLTLDYHGNGELGGDADLLRHAQAEEIAIVGSQIAPVVPFVSQLAIFDLPMVFAKYDGDKIEAVLNGDSETRKAIDAAYEENDLHCLGFLQNATYRLTTSNPEINDLASFKGLKIRTMENANHMAFWKAIGADPQPLQWADVFFSLQTGAIDAEENAADTVAGANFQEVQKYIACTNHILYCNQFCINKAIWEGLDPLYQQALMQGFQMTLDEMRPQLAEIDKTKKAELQEKGMTLVEYEDSFYDEVLALPGVQDLYKEIDSEVGGLGTTLQEELAK